MIPITHYTARFALLASIGLLAASCGKETSVTVSSGIGVFPTNIQSQIDRNILLMSQADLVLEYFGPDMFWRHKPLPPDRNPLSVSGTGALARAIPGTNDCGRDMALLIFPSDWPVMTNIQILEEVALELDGSIRAQGFRRVVHTVRSHGMLHEMFATGLLSHAELQLKKQAMIRVAEEFQRSQTTNKSTQPSASPRDLFAKIQIGMTRSQVDALLGAPSAP
jgi:hypothetical protein